MISWIKVRFLGWLSEYKAQSVFVWCEIAFSFKNLYTDIIYILNIIKILSSIFPIYDDKRYN